MNLTSREYLKCYANLLFVQRLSQAQSEILNAIAAIPQHGDIMDELRELPLDVKDDRHASEDLEFLRNLSTLDFSVKQKEACSKRHANTGQWLLDTKDFKD